MKLIIVVNNLTDTFETCILSRELSSEEIITINDMMGHGEHRTVHIAECGDKAIPFLDIVEVLKTIPGSTQQHLQEYAHEPGKITSLKGVPLKYKKE